MSQSFFKNLCKTKSSLILFLIAINVNQGLTKPISNKDCLNASCSCLMGSSAAAFSCCVGDCVTAGAAGAATACTVSSYLATQKTSCCSNQMRRCMQYSLSGANICAFSWVATTCSILSTFLPIKTAGSFALVGGATGASCGCMGGACIFCLSQAGQRDLLDSTSTSSPPPPITAQPKRLLVVPKETSVLIPDVNHQIQFSSLSAVQSILIPLSEQVLNLVKFFPIKTEYKNVISNVSSANCIYSLENEGNSLSLKHNGSRQKNYYPGKARLRIKLLQHIKLFVVYDSYINKPQTFSGGYLKNFNSKSFFTASSHVDTILTGIGLNLDGTGVSSYISVCSGLGRMNSKRELSIMNNVSKNKSVSDIILYGSFSFLGYNFFINRLVKLTPYVSYATSSVKIKGYKESYGPFFFKINKDEEQIKEKSFGVVSSLKLKNSVSLTVWSSWSFIKRVSNLYTKPFLSSMHGYFFPKNKRSYSASEVGINGSIDVTKRLKLNGSSVLTQTSKTKNNINFSLDILYRF